MGIARISCGQYKAGHDTHHIAIDRTYDRPGTDGTLSWMGDHAVLSTRKGSVRLHNHRPDLFEQAVARSSGATLLEEVHLLWVKIPVGASGQHPAGHIAQACFNVSGEAPEPCNATKDVDTTPSRSDTTLIEGGN